MDKLHGDQSRWQQGLDGPHDEPLEALHYGGCDYDRTIDIEAGH